MEFSNVVQGQHLQALQGAKGPALQWGITDPDKLVPMQKQFYQDSMAKVRSGTLDPSKLNDASFLQEFMMGAALSGEFDTARLALRKYQESHFGKIHEGQTRSDEATAKIADYTKSGEGIRAVAKALGEMPATSTAKGIDEVTKALSGLGLKAEEVAAILKMVEQLRTTASQSQKIERDSQERAKRSEDIPAVPPSGPARDPVNPRGIRYPESPDQSTSQAPPARVPPTTPKNPRGLYPPDDDTQPGTPPASGQSKPADNQAQTILPPPVQVAASQFGPVATDAGNSFVPGTQNERERQLQQERRKQEQGAYLEAEYRKKAQAEYLQKLQREHDERQQIHGPPAPQPTDTRKAGPNGETVVTDEDYKRAGLVPPEGGAQPPKTRDPNAPVVVSDDTLKKYGFKPGQIQGTDPGLEKKPKEITEELLKQCGLPAGSASMGFDPERSKQLMRNAELAGRGSPYKRDVEYAGAAAGVDPEGLGRVKKTILDTQIPPGVGLGGILPVFPGTTTWGSRPEDKVSPEKAAQYSEEAQAVTRARKEKEDADTKGVLARLQERTGRPIPSREDISASFPVNEDAGAFIGSKAGAFGRVPAKDDIMEAAKALSAVSVSFDNTDRWYGGPRSVPLGSTTYPSITDRPGYGAGGTAGYGGDGADLPASNTLRAGTDKMLTNDAALSPRGRDESGPTSISTTGNIHIYAGGA